MEYIIIEEYSNMCPILLSREIKSFNTVTEFFEIIHNILRDDYTNDYERLYAIDDIATNRKSEEIYHGESHIIIKITQTKPTPMFNKESIDYDNLLAWYADEKTNINDLSEEQQLTIIHGVEFDIKELKNGKKVLYDRKRELYDCDMPEDSTYWGNYYSDEELESLTEDDCIIFYKDTADALLRLMEPYVVDWFEDDIDDYDIDDYNIR